MKLLFLYINLSFLLSLDYAIIYDDHLYSSANSIANLYSNEVQQDFILDTEIISKNYIETFSGETLTEKLKNFILDLKEDHSELNYILILGDLLLFNQLKILKSYEEVNSKTFEAIFFQNCREVFPLFLLS